MIETEKFIKCVKNNPTIWKKTAKRYGDRLARENCWNLIGQQVYDAWEAKTEEERQEEVINMKNKWRHMRDSFNKYMNQAEGRFSGVKKRKYIYADNLTFLLNRGKRSTFKNHDTREKDDKSSWGNEENNTNEEVSSRNRHQSQTTSRKLLNSVTNSIQMNKQQTSKTPTPMQDDPDRCYLLSLLPEFKRLTDDQKLDFRFHTLQFFRVVRSKTIRRAECSNGWNQEIESNPLEGAASSYQSPEGSRDGSCLNSPESANSEQSATSFLRDSPTPLDSVKTELI